MKWDRTNEGKRAREKKLCLKRNEVYLNFLKVTLNSLPKFSHPFKLRFLHTTFISQTSFPLLFIIFDILLSLSIYLFSVSLLKYLFTSVFLIYLSFCWKLFMSTFLPVSAVRFSLYQKLIYFLSPTLSFLPPALFHFQFQGRRWYDKRFIFLHKKHFIKREVEKRLHKAFNPSPSSLLSLMTQIWWWIFTFFASKKIWSFGFNKKEESIQSSFNEFNLVWPNIHFQKIWFLIFSHPKWKTRRREFNIFRFRTKEENAKL